jgi:hypothetical protein
MMLSTSNPTIPCIPDAEYETKGFIFSSLIFNV